MAAKLQLTEGLKSGLELMELTCFLKLTAEQVLYWIIAYVRLT